MKWILLSNIFLLVGCSDKIMHIKFVTTSHLQHVNMPIFFGNTISDNLKHLILSVVLLVLLFGSIDFILVFFFVEKKSIQEPAECIMAYYSHENGNAKESHYNDHVCKLINLFFISPDFTTVNHTPHSIFKIYFQSRYVSFAVQ